MKTTKKLLAGICIMMTCLLCYDGNAQPWYGQIKYKHDSTILSSAKRTFQNAGYVMAGFRPVRRNTAASADFVIDKVSANGFFSSTTTDFSNEYRIYADPTNCSSPALVFQCEGVTIIETKNQGFGENYAIAGCYSQGIFFATLDVLGNVINQNFWPFPYAVGNDRKPVVRESVNTPGRYYICGTNSGIGYVMKVDFLGNQMWGNTYSPPYLEPRDLIESPYNSNELIVVGRTDVPGSPTAADAFYMSLDANSGNVNLFNYYNFLSWDSDDWFSCIELASSPTGGKGYVLGGRAFGPIGPYPSSSNARYTQWMCKLDQNGNVVWTTLIKPAAFIYNSREGDEVNRVVERFNANTNNFEYYGVAGSYYELVGSTAVSVRNLVVFKLDDNGKNLLTPNEFHYLGGGYAPESPSASSPYAFSDLTLIETGGGNDDGLQAFGTDYNPNGQSHYFCKAYFNGVSGCKEQQLKLDSLFTGPTLYGQTNVAFNPIAPCGPSGMALQLINLNTSPSTICYAPSVPNGSNARHALSLASGNSEKNQISLYPNPAKDKVTLSVPAYIKDQVSVIVFNNLGQKVQEYSFANAGNGEFTIDFNALGVKAGFYTLQINAGTLNENYKLIYEP